MDASGRLAASDRDQRTAYGAGLLIRRAASSAENPPSGTEETGVDLDGSFSDKGQSLHNSQSIADRGPRPLQRRAKRIAAIGAPIERFRTVIPSASS
jgi:hypothetical protein